MSSTTRLITDVQAGISLERQESRLGQVFDVVIDEVVEPGNGAIRASTSWRPTWRMANGWANGNAGTSTVLSGQLFPLRWGGHHFGYDLDGCVLLAAPDARPGEIVKAPSWRDALRCLGREGLKPAG